MLLVGLVAGAAAFLLWLMVQCLVARLWYNAGAFILFATAYIMFVAIAFGVPSGMLYVIALPIWGGFEFLLHKNAVVERRHYFEQRGVIS